MNCHRCGQELNADSLRFLVIIRVAAEFGSGPPSQGDADDLEMYMRRMDEKENAEVEDDVNQRQAFVLCPPCKEHFLRDPLRRTEGQTLPDEGGKVH